MSGVAREDKFLGKPTNQNKLYLGGQTELDY